MEYLDAQIQLCFFHFEQAVYRHIQSIGLARDYANNITVNQYCKMLVSLAFLPLNKVEEGFRMVCTNIENGITDDNLMQKLKKLMDYFLKTYVGGITLGGNQM